MSLSVFFECRRGAIVPTYDATPIDPFLTSCPFSLIAEFLHAAVIDNVSPHLTVEPILRVC